MTSDSLFAFHESGTQRISRDGAVNPATAAGGGKVLTSTGSDQAPTAPTRFTAETRYRYTVESATSQPLNPPSRKKKIRGFSYAFPAFGARGLSLDTITGYAV